MNRRSLCLMSLALALALAMSQVAAADVWVLCNKGQAPTIATVSKSGVSDVARRYPMVYGESPETLALVSYEKAAGRYQLDLIDKKTRQTTATWAVPALPTTLLAGAAPDLVLSGGFAYLLTHAAAPDGQGLGRNSQRGGFNVLQVRLSDGDAHTIELPDQFANPRLSDFDGIPVVTDWDGYAAWKIDSAHVAVGPLLGVADLDDRSAEARALERARVGYDARANFVVVPHSGIFRLSIHGELQRVVDADLRKLPAPSVSLDVGPARDVQQLFAATSGTGPAIAMIRRKQGDSYVAFVDARTMKISWEAKLAPDIQAWNVLPAGTDAVVYVSADNKALIRTAKSGTAVVRDLPDAGWAGASRILSFDKL
jgi:hypothetical protein